MRALNNTTNTIPVYVCLFREIQLLQVKLPLKLLHTQFSLLFLAIAPHCQVQSHQYFFCQLEPSDDHVSWKLKMDGICIGLLCDLCQQTTAYFLTGILIVNWHVFGQEILKENIWMSQSQSFPFSLRIRTHSQWTERCHFYLGLRRSLYILKDI